MSWDQIVAKICPQSPKFPSNKKSKKIYLRPHALEIHTLLFRRQPKLPMRIISKGKDIALGIEQQNVVISLCHLCDFCELGPHYILVQTEDFLAVGFGAVYVDFVHLVVL